MAFTTSNDVNILQSADLTAVGAGAGNDRYILDASLLTANQQITISDTEGINTLQLTGGLVITSSSVSNDAVRLTLNNGAVITVLGASSFSFQTGGALNGTGGTTQNFSTFTTSSLGIAGGVPAAGAAPATGGTVTVNANGGTGAGTVVPPVVGTTFTLTTGIDNLTGTDGNDTFLADNVVMSASDAINGGAGIDTLNYTDASTTGLAPNALVQNVEIINIRNVNGTAGVAGVTEVAQVTFNGFTTAGNTDTIVIAGLTLTFAAGTYTSTQIASAFNGATVVGIVATGTLTNYTVSAGDNATADKFTSTVAGNVADLTATVTGAAAAPAGITVTQGVAVVPSSGIPLTINASNFAGATDFNSNLSTVGVNFTNLTPAQKFGIIGNGAAVIGNVSAAYGTTATTSTLNVSGGVGPSGTTAPTVTITGGSVLTSSTINSTGSTANTLGAISLGSVVTALTINADARLATGAISGFTGSTATVTVSGAAAGTASATAVTIGGTLDAAIKTVNVSGLTVGGVSATLNANQTIVFTGGQGQDIITTGSILTSTGSVNAGAGTTDRLIVSTSNHIDSFTGKLYSNFEQLQVSDGVSVDVSLLVSTNTIDSIRINDGTNATGVSNLSATQAANVTILAANATGAITIGVKDATAAGNIDTVKAAVVTSNATNTTPVSANLTGIVLAGVEKLELTGTGTTTATAGSITLTTAQALSLDSIKLTSAGNGNIITVDSGHSGANLNIDASASTGSVTLNAVSYAAGTTGASLTGGSSFDILLGATAKADKLVGGAGNDVLVGSAITQGTTPGALTAGTATAIGSLTLGTGGTPGIAGSTASDIMTGGTGKDLFVLGINSGVVTISSITDLELGGATLALGTDQIAMRLVSTTAATIVTLTATQQTAVTSSVDLATALDLVASATNTPANNGTAQFTYGTDTYLFVNSSSTTATYVAGTDVVIKITGVVGTLDASDIVFI